MKPSPTTNAEITAEQALIAAFASDPKIDTALTALQTATDRYNAVKAKLNDAGIEAAAVTRESDARQALVRAQALSEIDQAAPADVEAARSEHIAARNALDSFGGRNEVLAGELRKIQTQVAEAKDTLTEALSTWKSEALATVRMTATEGARLIQTAAVAMHALGFGHIGVPRHATEFADWLTVNDVRAGVDIVAPYVAPTVSQGLQLLRRASNLVDEEIQTPKAPSPSLAPASAPRPAPSFSAPGIPHGLTHDALGNPLPGARPKLVAAAPYEDPRGDAQEIH
ncbi:hypothetical protein [Devosia sp.]|uniref:hypothetical protein n=1 Tax=Devosia sp. TaxID=1871048 RepID=UPI003267DCF3